MSPLFRGDVCLPGSTDVGDVSQVVPTGQIACAAAVIGTPGHSWQNAAQVGSSIGLKGMMAAGRILGLAAARAFLDPDLARRAAGELASRVEHYSCPIPGTIHPSDVLASMRNGNP